MATATITVTPNGERTKAEGALVTPNSKHAPSRRYPEAAAALAYSVLPFPDFWAGMGARNAARKAGLLA